MRRRIPLILASLTVLGGLWRLASFGFNAWPHGDVVIDAAISESLAWRGQLLVPFVDVRYYPIERFGFGYPPDQHPPLWPLLGASLVWLTGDGYTALKLLSLVVGVALIPLTYVALWRHVGQGPALFASALAAGSFPLVDFSGNGSLWALLAAIYLAWLWLLPEKAPTHRSGDALTANTSPTVGRGGRGALGSQGVWRRWALVGVVMGLGYLTNYPAVVLPVALAALHVVRHGRQAFRPAALAGPALSALVMLLVISPWLVYSASLFGGPFWSQPFQRTLAGGSRQVEYVLIDGEAVKRNLPRSGGSLAALRERATDLYGNIGFVAKQSIVLTPVLGGLFLVGLLLLVPMPPLTRRSPSHGAPVSPRPPLPPETQRPEGRGRVGCGGEGRAVAEPGSTDTSPTGVAPRATPSHAGPGTVPRCCDPWPVAVLALVHLALIIWWPTTKFRYVIPLLPLVFAIGAWALWQLQPGALRWRLAAVTLGLCLFTNAWTMISIPSHTYYYNGGLVADNFGQQGEELFIEGVRSFRAAADAIVEHGEGVVLGDHILAPFTRMPLVVNSTGYPPEIVEHLVQTYGVRYIVIDRQHASLYDFLRPMPIWTNDRHVVLELPRP